MIKSEHVFKEYFNETEETERVFDEKGFYKTGDLGLLDFHGRLKLIDKINQVCKNKNGNLISCKRLESVYLNSNLINQIFVYCCQEKKSLVAVVVPNETILRTLAQNNNLVLDMDRFCKNSIFKKIILNELNQINDEFKLETYEKVILFENFNFKFT